MIKSFIAVCAGAPLLALGFAVPTASAQPNVGDIVNSTCTYPQVMAALSDLNPGVASELNANPMTVAWLQGLVAAPPNQRAQMVQQVQGIPRLQPYIPVIFQVAGSCNRY